MRPAQLPQLGIDLDVQGREGLGLGLGMEVTGHPLVVRRRVLGIFEVHHRVVHRRSDVRRFGDRARSRGREVRGYESGDRVQVPDVAVETPYLLGRGRVREVGRPHDLEQRVVLARKHPAHQRLAEVADVGALRVEPLEHPQHAQGSAGDTRDQGHALGVVPLPVPGRPLVEIEAGRPLDPAQREFRSLLSFQYEVPGPGFRVRVPAADEGDDAFYGPAGAQCGGNIDV